MSAVSTYQHHVLNVFVYEKAKRIREKHLDDTLPDDILEWSVNERFVVFEDLRNEDPMVLAWLIWHPFTHPIDSDSIFFPPDKATAELEALMERWQLYLFHCWMNAAETAVNFRLSKRIDRKTLDLKALAGKKPDSIGKIPTVSKKGKAKRASQSKSSGWASIFIRPFRYPA
ncbi:hypothetical protein UCDDS831_g08544 [Diplodia seriata]|uniref:Uncharacterized protein n=1 Tax=Diplodia seriata TaxID=420778 RepID=A0A0G2DTK9_9PEZI|nr:hypothetical protein UCDDS831_g08544 [Diplodia seriata]